MIKENKNDNWLSGCLVGALLVLGIFMYVGFDHLVPLLWAASYWIGMGLLSVAIVATITGVVWAIDKIAGQRLANELVNVEIQTKAVETIANEHGVWLADHRTGVVKTLHLDPRLRHNGNIIEPTEDERRNWYFYIATKYGKAGASLPLVPDITIEHKPALELVAPLDRLMLVGGSGSGKTSMAQYIVENRGDNVIVLDPHDDKQTWPGNAKVIGGGMDYDGIASELMGLSAEVNKRYKRRADEGIQPHEFTPIFFVLDEWREVLSHRPELNGQIRQFLTALRKVNMSFLLISQSDRAEPLGLKGENDLRESFEGILRLSGNKKTGIKAELETQEGKVIVEHPGPYQPKLLRSGIKEFDDYVPGNYVPVIPDEEQRVLDLYAQGNSKTKIGSIVYGQKGGKQNELVSDILRKHKRIP